MADTKRFTRAEVESYNRKDNSLFIIHNYVYDVKSFLDEHPGGHEVLISAVGKDASEEFDDTGHTLKAKDQMKNFRIGELVEAEKTFEKKTTSNAVVAEEEDEGFLSTWKVPIILGLLAALVYHYLF